MAVLSGDSYGQGSSILQGAWLECPGALWYYWAIFRLHNVSDSPIVVDSIEYNVILGPDAVGYVYDDELYQWNANGPRVTNNFPPSCGQPILCPECVYDVDDWVEGLDTIATLTTGELLYAGALPDPPDGLLHTFTGTGQTWTPLGGLTIAPGGSIAIASFSQMNIEIVASPETIPPAEMEIAATLPALTAAVTLEADFPVPENTFHQRRVGALYLGTSGQIHRYDYGLYDEVEGEDVDIPLKILSRAIAPAGVAGEALFTSLYLNITNLREQNLTVTPIINGIRQTSTVVQLPARSEPKGAIYEVPLFAAYLGLLSHGMRGTWFSVEVTAPSAARDHHLSFGKSELEIELLRETQTTGITYSGLEVVQRPVPVPRPLLLGGPGDIREWDTGRYDDETAIPLRWQSLEYAPAGEGGECIFTALYLPLFRSNTVAFDLVIDTYVDNELQESRTVSFTEAATPLLEVIELGLSLPLLSGVTEYGRAAQRGTWFSVRVTGDRPDGELHFYPPVLEYDIVRETQDV